MNAIRTIAPPNIVIKPIDPSSHLEPGSGLWIPEEVYWEEYYEHPNCSYEWNNGYLEERPMSNYVEYSMYQWFVQLLYHYLLVHPIARMIALETGFRLVLPHRVTIRKPDLGLVLHNNPIPLHDTKRSYAGTFDLCVESLSNSTRHEIDRDVIHKKQEYELVGVREYYILDPSRRYMAFYGHTSSGIYQPLEPIEGIIRSGVLPGFQFRIADLWRQPTVIELANDEVYRNFILPEHQLVKQEAVQAENRAKQAENRAKQAEQEAERLAAKLRALGISPD